MSNKIILGSANFGNDYSIGNQKKLSNKTIFSILRHYSSRVNVAVDTASGYNDSESIIGSFNSKNKNKIKVITKFNFSDKLNIFETYQKSFSRLKKKPLAILFHNSKDYFNQLKRKNLFKLKSKNLVKKVGVSIYTTKEIEKLLRLKKNIPDIIQLPLNLFDNRAYKSGLLKKLKQKNIELHARSVFLRGILFYNKKKLIKHFPSYEKNINSLNLISLKKNLNLGYLSLCFVNTIDEIDKIVLGVRDKNHLNSIINCLKTKLSYQDMSDILKHSINNKEVINPSKWKIKY